MAIAIDASSPAAVQSTGRPTSIVTASFSPPANSLLVALTAAGWDNTTGIPVISISDSSSHAWTTAVSRQGTQSGFGGGTAIFYSYLAAAPGSITVTTSFSAWDSGASGGGAFCDLLVLTGTAASAQLAAGATASQEWLNVTTGTVSITTNTPGSMVFGVSNDSGSDHPWTANSNTQANSDYDDTTDKIRIVGWSALAATGTPGATTFGGTWAAATYSTHCAFEVLPVMPPRGLVILQAVNTAGRR